MKEHVQTQVQEWKDSVDDYTLLRSAGVPHNLALRAAALDEKKLPLADRWVNFLDHVHKPTLEQVQEQPDLPGMGLVLWGGSGQGKTIKALHILLGILRSDRLHWVDDSVSSRLLFPILGYFFDWQDLSEVMRRSNSDDPPALWPAFHAVLDGMPHLQYDFGRYGGGAVILDDLSRERQTEYNQDRLHAILRKRYNETAITIVTTNFSPEYWLDVYGPVLSAFMMRSFVEVEVS
jgi:DNA replication protein DnaC